MLKGNSRAGLINANGTLGRQRADMAKSLMTKPTPFTPASGGAWNHSETSAGQPRPIRPRACDFRGKRHLMRNIVYLVISLSDNVLPRPPRIGRATAWSVPTVIQAGERTVCFAATAILPWQRVGKLELPDMALLATTEPLEAARLRAALERTFAFRATHPLPTSLPNPPANWLTPYVEMARENELAWMTLEQLTAAVVAFLNPVLAGNGGVWRPAAWAWDSSAQPQLSPQMNKALVGTTRARASSAA
jgi:hypothetical protein